MTTHRSLQGRHPWASITPSKQKQRIMAIIASHRAPIGTPIGICAICGEAILVGQSRHYTGNGMTHLRCEYHAHEGEAKKA
ncbi:MAG: hypothetical protein J7M34_15015 [Anaerolineae bacterium]|nr:hypothetical protein [Anaerolineae bacterium]